jgi:hypothetical protein
MPIWASFPIEEDASVYKLAKIAQNQNTKLFLSSMGQSKSRIFHHYFHMSKSIILLF